MKFDGVLNINKLQQLIRQIQGDLGSNLYRYKGVLNVAGIDHKYVFQGVGMLYTGRFTSLWLPTDKRECRSALGTSEASHEEVSTVYVDAS